MFARVVEHGSFTRAASELGVSKSVISSKTAALEARLGEQLLLRTTRKVSATAAGIRTYALARQMLEAAGAATEGASQTGRGVLRVSAPVTLAQEQLARPLSAFLRQHPGTRVELLLNDRIVDLVEERERGRPGRPEQLLRHDCLRYNVLTAEQEWRLYDGKGRVELSVRGAFETSSGTMRRASQGSAWPCYRVSWWQRRSNVVRLRPFWTSLRRARSGSTKRTAKSTRARHAPGRSARSRLSRHSLASLSLRRDCSLGRTIRSVAASSPCCSQVTSSEHARHRLLSTFRASIGSTQGARLSGGTALLLGLKVRVVAALLIPVMLGALGPHVANGWMFANQGGGWEYVAFLLAVLLSQALLGPGAFALSSRHTLGREAHAVSAE